MSSRTPLIARAAPGRGDRAGDRGGLRHPRPRCTAAQQAEQAQDYDRAVVEYTKVAWANPTNADGAAGARSRQAARRAGHTVRGRRLAGLERYEEAVIEFQVASELNPTDRSVDAALRDARQKLRTKLAVTRGGKTELREPDRTDARPAGARARSAGGRQAARLAGLRQRRDRRVVFLARRPVRRTQHDLRPGVPRSAAQHRPAQPTLGDALASLTASTHTFYRVTAPRTITIVPDTPAKRREYEESIIRTFYLSNADIKETIDLLRVVVDIRQISPDHRDQRDLDQGHARAHRRRRQADQRDRQGAAGSRHRRRAAGSRSHASCANTGCRSRRRDRRGINGSVDINRDDLTLANLKNLTAADVFLSGIPGLYYRLLKNDTARGRWPIRICAPSDGLPAPARFGEEVPVPSPTFAPIAAGGVNSSRSRRSTTRTSA